MPRADRRSFAALVLLSAAAGWLPACGPLRPPAEPPIEAPVGAPAGSDTEFAAALAERFRPQAGSRVLRVRPTQSLVEIQVYREGSLARLGHNHLIAVRRLQGWWRQAADGSGTAELWFRVDQLTVDEPALRQAAGPEFAPQPDVEAVAATRANMLGEQVLAAQAHPRVWIAADYRPGDGSVALTIDLRGVRRELRIPVELRSEGAVRVVRGALPLRLSDFGLEPFSALGGALRVADRLQVRFEIRAEPVAE